MKKELERDPGDLRSGKSPWHIMAVSGLVLFQVIASATMLPLIVEAFTFPARFPHNYPNNLYVILGITVPYVLQLTIWLWGLRSILSKEAKA